MIWFLYALSAAIFSAINRTLIKNAGTKSSDITVTFSLYLFASIPTLAMIPLVIIPVIQAEFYLYVLLAAISDIAGIIFMSKSLRLAPMGRAVPLLAFTPAILLVTGFLLVGEVPTLIGGAGVLIIVFGSYILHLDTKQYSLVQPFKMLTTSPGARYMLGTALCFSFTGPLYKQAILHSSPSFALIVGLPLSVILIMIYQLFRRRTITNLLPEKDNLKTLLFLGASVFIVAYSTNLAFSTGLVSYVISIKRLSIFFNILIGFFFFKEQNLGRNLLAAAIMIAGATIIIFQ
jgi:drug/metabolite transporter (DMT)-like permease